MWAVLSAKASAGFAKNLRNDMFGKIQDYSFENIDKFSTPSLVTRLTTDVTNLQNSYQMIIRIAVRSPAMLIFSLTMALSINAKISVIFLCVITCILGMVIPGSSIVVIFGPMFITSLASAGVDPLLAAAMLPCICGVMCGITPPLGLGMYAGMTLAESDFTKTFNNNLFWVAAQFILQVVVLMGWLPILGL